MTGKIIKGIAGFYYVHCADHQIYECKAKGIFRNKKIKPLVGDNVEITVLNTDPPEGNIDRDPGAEIRTDPSCGSEY